MGGSTCRSLPSLWAWYEFTRKRLSIHLCYLVEVLIIIRHAQKWRKYAGPHNKTNDEIR
jgi:hypothetical protein